jgi:starch synthase
MIAAECKGIAKVGGLGDVVYDLANALHAQGVPVRIVMPAYGSARFPAGPATDLAVPFAGRTVHARVLRTKAGNVDVFGIASAEFFDGPYARVYVDSSAAGKGPFEDDAARFAFFGAAAAEMAGTFPEFASTTVYHCHDWHAAAFMLLARTRDTGAFPGNARFLLTIHNLDYQGLRPFEPYPGDQGLGTFAGWFPGLRDQMASSDVLSAATDPTHAGCFNPMRTAIQLADQVNTVSPTYATEITLPDDPARNFVGGRGLQSDLAAAAAAGRLSGILNGIDYKEHDPAALDPPFDAGQPLWWKAKATHKRQVLADLCARGQSQEIVGSPDSREVFVHAPLAVCVTRLAAQKVSLLTHRIESGRCVLEELATLPIRIVILGTGELQGDVASVCKSSPGVNCHLIPAFDPKLARALYAAGDLFLMPSDFEPCGISQMIAMRHGTVPIAAAVGGLVDTIRHGEDGFLFAGTSRDDAARKFLFAVREALFLLRSNPDAWRKLQESAMARRFTWEESAARYLALYSAPVRTGRGA